MPDDDCKIGIRYFLLPFEPGFREVFSGEMREASPGGERAEMIAFCQFSGEHIACGEHCSIRSGAQVR
jgi:hypothetical protein